VALSYADPVRDCRPQNRSDIPTTGYCVVAKDGVPNADGHTFTVNSKCSVVLLYCFSLNEICCVIACTFSSTPKSLGGITIMLITLKCSLKANFMLLRLLCAYRMTKYDCKILL